MAGLGSPSWMGHGEPATRGAAGRGSPGALLETSSPRGVAGIEVRPGWVRRQQGARAGEAAGEGSGEGAARGEAPGV